MTSPLCGHGIMVPCRQRTELSQPIWDQSRFSEICSTGMIQQDTEAAHALSNLSHDIEQSLNKCHGVISMSLKCGHVKKLACVSLLHALQDEDYPCHEEVEILLRCGHSTRVSCSKAKMYSDHRTNIQCKESESKACWNHASCGIQLVVKCGFTGIVACKNPTTWTCPLKKHSYEMKQCTEGPPVACPGCSFGNLKEAIERSDSFDVKGESEKLVAPLVETRIEWLLCPGRMAEFVENERAMLMGTKAFVETLSLWKRPIFKVQRVPCFRVLKGPFLGLDWFDPRKLVKQKTLHGLLTTRLTQKSMNWLMSSCGETDEVILLLGMASVSRTLTSNMQQLPKAKKMNKLYNRVQHEGYDSVAFVDSDGCEKLVLMDPFPIVAICRLHLKLEDMHLLAQQLAKVTSFNLELEKNQRTSVPGDLCLSVPAKALSGCDEEIDDQSTGSNEDKPQEFDGTILEGFVIEKAWNKGGIMSDGTIPETIERDLEQKMKFVNSNASPFAAIKLLRKLRDSRNITTPLLDLLFAAECIRQDATEAKAHLEKYLQAVSDEGSSRKLHPWSMVVAARLAADESEKKRLLCCFLSSCPSQKYLLSEDEQAYAEEDSDDEEELLIANLQVDPLCERWEALKDSNPSEVNSDAMEVLLKLTGLRKVKQEALSLCERALQLMRMDDDTRKANVISSNYCFLGNPGMLLLLCTSFVFRSTSYLTQLNLCDGPRDWKNHRCSAFRGDIA